MSEEAKVSILMDNAQAAAELERAAAAWERAANAQSAATKEQKEAAASQLLAAQAAARVARERTSSLQQSAYQQALQASGVPSGLYATMGAPGSGLGGAMGAAAGAMGVYAAGHAMSAAAGAMAKLGDSTKRFDERLMSAAEGIPVVGTLVKGFRDLAEAVKGSADAMRRQAMAAEAIGGTMPMQHRARYAEMGAGTQAGVLRSTSTFWAGQARRGFAGLGVADPRNLYDPYQAGAFSRQIGLAQSKQGILAGIAETEARGRGLNDERVGLDNLRTGAMDRLRSAQGDEQKARAGAHWLGSSVFGNSKAEIDRASRAQLQASRELMEIEQKIKENTENRQQNAMELERKRGELVGHSIALEKERLTVLKEQEGIVRAQTQGWGRATGAERQVATAWARQAQRDPNSLARGQWDYLQRFAPNFVARHMEQRGEADPMLREFQALTGTLNNTPQGLGANLREQQDVEKRIAELSTKKSADTARLLEGAFGKFTDDIIAALLRIVKIRGDEIRNGQTIRNNGG